MNGHFCPDIVEIHACGGYTVKAKFADGTTKICDLSDHLGHGIFKKLKDEDFFKLVHAKHGAAVWDDKVDIAPEYLYEHGKSIN